LASPSAGATALKYGDVNTETTSPGEVKGLIKFFLFLNIYNFLIINNENINFLFSKIIKLIGEFF